MNKIKEARQQAGLTQKAMHEMFGIPKEGVALILAIDDAIDLA